MANNRQKQTTSWLLIALVLSNHGIGMASRIEERGRLNKLENKVEWYGKRNRPSVKQDDFHKAQENFSRMSCDELGGALRTAMTEVSNRLIDRCNSDSCSFSDSESSEVRSLSLLSMKLTAIADVADTKMCLPEVMSTAGGSLHGKIFPFMQPFLDSAVSEQARERFTMAFQQITILQEDIHALRGDVVDRRLLMPTNIESPAVCPSACQECTTEHNSWMKDDEEFSFKCVLNTGDPKPESDAFTCADPVPRNGMFHKHKSKTWCKVHDWLNLAEQTLAVSAKITCGAKAIFAPLQTGEEMSPSLRETCERKESGEAVTQESLDELIELDNTVGDVVSAGNLAIFSVFMAVELIEAVSRLRRDTRSSSLISVGSDGVEESPQQQDPPYTYVKGSWRCRRSILSLARGLFGGMIQIVVGVGYLALMATFGLLTTMQLFGVDNVLTFFWSTTTDGITTNVAGEIGASIAENPVAIAAAEEAASAGAAAAGATASAAANSQAVAAAGEASLATSASEGVAAWIAAQLAELALLVETYYWFALAGSVGFAVLFGIWGAMKIRNSYRSPYDCSSGFVGRGPHAVCHPAMKYGEGVHEQCPGTTGTDKQISFICSKENKGVATFMNDCHFFDE